MSEFDIAVQACNHVLAKLAVMSGMGTRWPTLERRGPNKPESKPPPAVGDSPFFHFRERMTKALAEGNLGLLYLLAAEATRAYLENKGRYRPPQYENHRHAVKELIEQWEGTDAAIVAAWLCVSEKWVRKERSLAGKDPQTGLPAEKGDARRERVFAMLREGKKQIEIAAELGIGRATVNRIVKRASE